MLEGQSRQSGQGAGGAKNGEKMVEGGGGKNPMTPEAASRIQSTYDSKPDSPTHQTGFGPRAQRAADRNENAMKQI